MVLSRRQFLGGLAASTTMALGGCAARFGHPQSYASQVVSLGKMNPVFHWTDIALQALRDQGVAPPLATRALAMGHVAGFLAVNGIAGFYEDHYRVGNGPAHANADVAYGAAFSTAIAEHFQQTFAGDRKLYFSQFADGEAKSAGMHWGMSVGKHIVRLRTHDGAEPSKVNYSLGRYKRRRDALHWSPTAPQYDAGEGPYIDPTYHDPLLPGFGAVKPWALRSIAPFRAPEFHDPRSREFAEEFAEIKAIGASDSRVRTREQSEIALFWEDGPWGITPPGHFTLIAMQLLQHRDMSLPEMARAFALISMAMADAGISTWDSKYSHDIIRPETAIRKSAQDFGNSDRRVVGDAGWKSYIPTPPFPAYTSGHSAFGAAAMRMLAHVLGRDDISFGGMAPDVVIWPKTLSTAARYWTSLSQAADENGISRVYGGVHWNADNVQALGIGRAIADEVFSTAFGGAG